MSANKMCASSKGSFRRLYGIIRVGHSRNGRTVFYVFVSYFTSLSGIQIVKQQVMVVSLKP